MAEEADCGLDNKKRVGLEQVGLWREKKTVRKG